MCAARQWWSFCLSGWTKFRELKSNTELERFCLRRLRFALPFFHLNYQMSFMDTLGEKHLLFYFSMYVVIPQAVLAAFSLHFRHPHLPSRPGSQHTGMQKCFWPVFLKVLGVLIKYISRVWTIMHDLETKCYGLEHIWLTDSLRGAFKGQRRRLAVYAWASQRGSKHPHKKTDIAKCICVPEMSQKRQEDPWGLLAGWSCQIGKLQSTVKSFVSETR